MPSYPAIVLFGDSITEYAYRKPSGLSTSLALEYSRRLDIITRGFGGYNTKWAKPLLEPILSGISGEIKAVVIFFGANDAAAKSWCQHVPVERYKENLAEMVKTARKYTPNVIIVGPTLVDETINDVGTLRTNKAMFEYNRAAKQISSDTNSEFIDLWTIFRLSNNDPVTFEQPLPGEINYKGDKSVTHLVPDGIHFSSTAYDIWLEALKDSLATLNLAREDIPFVYPPWGRLVDEDKKHQLTFTR